MHDYKSRFSLSKHLYLAGLTLLYTFGGTSNALASEPIPIETLAKLPAVSNLSLSRDGDYMTGLIGQDGSEKLMLAVWDPRDLSKPPKTTIPDGKVEFIYAEALKADKILVVARTKWTGALAGCGEGKSIGATKTYLTKIFITDTNFSDFSEPFEGLSKRRDMSSFEKVCSQIAGTGNIAADLPLDPDNIIISNSSGVFDSTRSYIKYNLRTGKAEVLFKNRSHDTIGLLDPRTGEVWTKSTGNYDDGRYKSKILLKNAATGNFEVHEALTSDSNDRHNVSILGRDETTGKYYISTDQFSDKMRVYMYDPIAKSYDKSPLFQNEQFNISNITRSASEQDFGKVLSYNETAARPETHYLDAVFQSVQSKFNASFPSKKVSITDWSYDRSTLLISVEGSDMPPAFYLTRGGSDFKFLGTERPELAKASLSKTELVYYEARDGKQIPGLLTMPVGWNKGDAAPPAIIHPHGGPWARDNANWDASGWVPFLTSRGYAVLQPQYRGSTGWGRDIWLSGDAEWGQKMQDDKDDGAQWLISNGYADADKVAIFGYSYGGFAAFAAAVRPQSPYKCAIAGAGVSDLKRLGRLWSNNPQQRAYQGKTVKGMNPLEYAKNTNIPMLIFHGDHDVRVPLFHAKDFYKKAKNKVKAKLVIIKDQPHSLPWTPKMQRKSLSALENYLENDCFN